MGILDGGVWGERPSSTLGRVCFSRARKLSESLPGDLWGCWMASTEPARYFFQPLELLLFPKAHAFEAELP